MFVDSLGSCESLCCSLGGRGGDVVFTPSSKSPESQYHDRKRGQNAASASCYFKGEGNRSLLEPTMGHIFSQWGSLMCEQGSGRAVNRAFYEAARGELGLSMEGTKPRTPCGHARPGLVCFDGSTGLAWLRALFTLDMYQAAEPAPHEKTQLWGCIRTTTGGVHLGTLVYTAGTRVNWSCWLLGGWRCCVSH